MRVPGGGRELRCTCMQIERSRLVCHPECLWAAAATFAQSGPLGSKDERQRGVSVAVDEIREFRADENSHRHSTRECRFLIYISISRLGLKSGLRCLGEYPRGLQITRVPRELEASLPGTT